MEKNIIDSYDPIRRIKTIPTVRTPISQPSTNMVIRAIILIAALVLAIVFFGLSPTTWAQLSPPSDGGYFDPDGFPSNTAEGTDALFHLCQIGCVSGSSSGNTAIGFTALYNTDYGNNNTGIGSNALFSNTHGSNNTATGVDALHNNTYGSSNTANGTNALYGNDTGSYNTAIGEWALLSNTSGYYNTASGDMALYANTTGEDNTATGVSALLFNTIGSSNTATGFTALEYNTTGGNNTANGTSALYFNETGSSNTANGVGALQNNRGGNYNTANGAGALLNNTASGNTATGVNALYSNTIGLNNTASGTNALYNNRRGNSNTANGKFALYSNINGSSNMASGVQALYHNTSGGNNLADGTNALYNNTTGGNNLAFGTAAGFNLTTGSNNIEIGNLGVAAEANTIRLGTVGTQQATYIAGISGKVVAGGVGVIVDTNGHLGTVVSSAHYKDAIQPMDKTSEAILALQPVTFRYKKELDPQGIPQFGLVAEQVAKVDPDLVARDQDGKPYTVRYEAVNAMLLNEFLKEHRKVEEQASTIAKVKSVAANQATTIAQQQKEIVALTAALKAQAAQIQKVSDQLMTQAPAQRVAAND